MRDNYDRAVAEWLAGGRSASPPPTVAAGRQNAGDGCSVAELCLAFLGHAEGHYQNSDGGVSGELREYRRLAKLLNDLYGGMPVPEFGPLKLKAFRERLVLDGLSRGVVNQRVGKVVRMFRHGVGEELVSPAVYQALKAEPGLRRGRTAAREAEAISPVPPDAVESVLPHCSGVVAGIVRFLRHAGCRPGEALRMRLEEIDRRPGVWLYRPASHKTAWRGKDRVVALGPKSQAVILEVIRIRCPLCGVEGRPPRIGCRDGSLCGPCSGRMDEGGVHGPWTRAEVQPPGVPLFSPLAERQERYQDKRAARKSKVQPSQRCRKQRKPVRTPRERYSVESLNRAIARACERAGVDRWHPNQLRHLCGTQVRSVFGLEGAQVALGHSQARVTEIYAQRDLSLAVRIAETMG